MDGAGGLSIKSTSVTSSSKETVGATATKFNREASTSNLQPQNNRTHHMMYEDAPGRLFEGDSSRQHHTSSSPQLLPQGQNINYGHIQHDNNSNQPLLHTNRSSPSLLQTAGSHSYLTPYNMYTNPTMPVTLPGMGLYGAGMSNYNPAMTGFPHQMMGNTLHQKMAAAAQFSSTTANPSKNRNLSLGAQSPQFSSVSNRTSKGQDMSMKEASSSTSGDKNDDATQLDAEMEQTETMTYLDDQERKRRARQANTESARRSREAKQKRSEVMAIQASHLEMENIQLRSSINVLTEYTQYLASSLSEKMDEGS